MKHDTVESTMTSEVVKATYDTPFEEITRLLSQHRISGLPVVDDDDEKVIGVDIGPPAAPLLAHAELLEGRPMWRIQGSNLRRHTPAQLRLLPAR